MIIGIFGSTVIFRFAKEKKSDKSVEFIFDKNFSNIKIIIFLYDKNYCSFLRWNRMTYFSSFVALYFF